MDNVISYLKFRQDITFKQAPFNESDAVVFASLVSLNYDGVFQGSASIQTVAENYKKVGKGNSKDEMLKEKEQLLFLAAKSKRFSQVIFENYVKDINKEDEMTFYAITFRISRFESFVTFRGTDGSLLSWKENFTGLFNMPTPGQYRALKYLSNALKKPFEKVSVVGHSKGGNLAVYASMMLDEKLQKKIKNIYVLDGPGFMEDVSNKLGYLRIVDRIKAYVPKSCIVGNLMHPTYERIIVEAEGTGVYQHDMLTWHMDAFGLCKAMEQKVDETGENISVRINNWIESIPVADRRRVVDELFDVFEDNGIIHISDIIHMDLKGIVHTIKSLTSLSAENRELIGIIFKQVRSRR